MKIQLQLASEACKSYLHSLFQYRLNAGSGSRLALVNTRPLFAHDTGFNALDVVHEELTLKAVVHYNTHVHSVKDDESQGTDDFQNNPRSTVIQG